MCHVCSALVENRQRGVASNSNLKRRVCLASRVFQLARDLRRNDSDDVLLPPRNAPTVLLHFATSDTVEPTNLLSGLVIGRAMPRGNNVSSVEIKQTAARAKKRYTKGNVSAAKSKATNLRLCLRVGWERRKT